MAIDQKEDHGPMKLIFNYNNVFYSFFYDDLSGCIHRSREFALNYVYSGEMILDNGAEQIRVQKGECVFIPREHHITMYKKTYRGERYCGFFLMFTRSFLREMYSKLSINRIRPNTDRLPDGAINAAAADPRIKATLASTMYDMSRVDSNGYFEADVIFAPTTMPKPAMLRARDWPHSAPRTTSTAPRNSAAAFPTFYPTTPPSSSATITTTTKHSAPTIPVDQHHRIPSKENNKLFMVIPGASHTDLYDQKDIIPFASIEKFFSEYLGE